MRKLILVVLLLFSSAAFSCHESYTTLVSGPTSIGGGQYTTTVQFCIGQTVNWGGTFDFTVTLNGANFVSYSPTTLSNTYGAYTTAGCGGPNCFMGTCASITTNAGSNQTGNTVTYTTTTSSTPIDYPLVPDDVEQCGGNPTSFCFNFTFVSDALPTSIILAGNIEMYRPRVCDIICEHSGTYTGGPCNGTYDPAMTYTFGTPLPIDLVLFDGFNELNVNSLFWITDSEINNEYFIVERTQDIDNWEVITTIDGAGDSNSPISYKITDNNYPKGVNYYRLTQVDFNGDRKSYNIISIDNEIEVIELVKVVNFMGQEVLEYEKGVYIFIYSDGTIKKVLNQ